MTRDERAMAYADGELTGDDRVRFEAEMAADPALVAEVAQHRRLSGRVAETYAPVLDEPVPPHLVALASVANDPGPRRSAVPQWAAMAACLLVGVLAGRALYPDQGPLATRGGALVARGGLEKALTTQLASQGGGVIKVGLTFKDHDGAWCRTFESAPDRLAGLACRADGRWVARTTSVWTPAAAGPEYRTAGSDTPPAVLAAVDAAIAGAPLDAAAERSARDGGWKP